jgi:hypothetical protein
MRGSELVRHTAQETTTNTEYTQEFQLGLHVIIPCSDCTEWQIPMQLIITEHRDRIKQSGRSTFTCMTTTKAYSVPCTMHRSRCQEQQYCYLQCSAVSHHSSNAISSPTPHWSKRRNSNTISTMICLHERNGCNALKRQPEPLGAA